MGDTLRRLLEASLNNASLYTYRQPWEILLQFKRERLPATTPIFPLSSDTLALFLAYLAEKKYAGSTVMTYVSAVSYPHRLAGWPDPTKNEMVKLALRGYSKLYPSQDTRLPITLPILERIITACNQFSSVCYQRKLLQAMFSLAFFAALRVGEITGGPGQHTKNVITFDQLFFLRDDLDSIVAAKLVLKHYKHSDPTQPVELLIYRDQPICPVSQMLDYVSVRGNAPGPLFCWADGSPISRTYFTRSLKEVLRYCNLDEDRYKTHSFCIGAASWAAAKGMSDSQIRAFGRWNSNAFLKYIRMPTLGTES